MAIPPNLAMGLFLFQLLCPFLAALLLSLAARRDSFRHGLGLSLHLLLIVSSSLLAGVILDQTLRGEPAVIRISQALPLSPLPTVLDQLSWRLDHITVGIVTLLPWASLTIYLFAERPELRRKFLVPNFLLIGAFQFFLVGSDIGSCLTGGFAAALIISYLMVSIGNQKQRHLESDFLTVQWIGGMMLAAGLAMFIAASSLTQAAPRGLPGNSSAILNNLGETVQSAVTQHEAASEFWKDSRGLPLLIIVLAIVLMSGCFPVHIWLSRALSQNSLGLRIWLIVWAKGMLLLGLKWISLLDQQTIIDLQGWGLFFSLAGAIFMGSLMFGHSRHEAFFAATVGWTQAIACLAICGAGQNFDRIVTPWLLCQCGALILLAISTSFLMQQTTKQDEFADAPTEANPNWLAPVLAICLISLTFTPLAIGAFQGWLTFAALRNWNETGTYPVWTMLLIANLMALAGLIRFIQRALASQTNDPEDSTSPILIEPISTLTIMQRITLCYWGLLAIGLGFLFPLFLQIPRIHAD